MNVGQAYIEKIEAAESVFDMAVICYKILADKIEDPVAFISKYVDESEEGVSLEYGNPNYKSLRFFAEKVSDRLEKYSELDFPRQKSDIVNWIKELSLEAFLEEEKNQLSVVFTLLSVIDGLVPLWTERGIKGKGPLNQGKSKEDCYAYLTCRKSIHEPLIQKIGRERKANGDFGETLDNLLFIRKEELPKGSMPPEICSLTRKNVEFPSCVTIAVLTGLSGCHFKQKRTYGSTRIIEYIQEIQTDLAEKIWKKVQKAIKKGAEFIILPEFCVSEEIRKYISERLLSYKLNESEKSKLIAVFPGSTWIETNDNVQFIMDAWGREKGQYYKNTPFRKRKKDESGYQFCEGLTHPGYRTSLLRIEGLGYILPATCRDVIDGPYTCYYVSRFHPAFLFVPAWSTSGQAFVQPLKRYAMDYYTNSVLCNGCGALKKKTSIAGGAVIPAKDKTVASGHFKEIKMTQTQSEGCAKECDKLCSYMLKIDFAGSDTVRRCISCRKY